MSPHSPLTLPEDIIAEILSYLPVKSLLQFRSVNHSWNSLILDPAFAKLHLSKSSIRTGLFTLVTHHIKYYVREDDFDHDYSVVPYSITSLIDNPVFTHFEDDYYHLNDGRCSDMIGTCNGLILLGDDIEVGNSHEYRFNLWNPSTRTTSAVFGYFRDSSPEYFGFWFGCDDSTNTYKVVASRHIRNQLTTEVRILSFDENVWKNIGSFPVVPIDLRFQKGFVYLNSTCNWLAMHNYFDYKIDNIESIKGISVKKFVIVSLDLGTETYKQYQLPSSIDDQLLPVAPIISLLGGSLCFSYCYKKIEYVIWKMNEFGNEESWTQLFRISYQNLSSAYDYEYDDTIKYHLRFFPLFLSDDGCTLILRTSEMDAILYNWRDNRVERINITPNRVLIDDDTIDNIFWSLAKVYVESLVSVF